MKLTLAILGRGGGVTAKMSILGRGGVIKLGHRVKIKGN